MKNIQSLGWEEDCFTYMVWPSKSIKKAQINSTNCVITNNNLLLCCMCSGALKDHRTGPALWLDLHLDTWGFTCRYMNCSDGSRGGASPSPLIFRPNLGRKVWKVFFGDHPSLISGSGCCPPLVSRFDTVLLCCYHHGNSSETLLKVFTSKSGPMYNFRSKLIFSLAEA